MANWFGYFSGDSSATNLKTIEHKIAVGTVSQKTLVQLHHVLLAALRQEDTEQSAKAVDALKAAYGAGLCGENENVLLKQAFSCAMEKRYFSIAGYLLEAYRPLFRMQESISVKRQLVQDVSLLAVLALRKGDNAIASTAIDVLLYFSLRSEDEFIDEIVDALRLIGLESIRQRDGGLLLELSRQLAKAKLFAGEKSGKAWLYLLETWLASINDNPFIEAGQAFLPVLEAAESGLTEVEWSGWMQSWGILLRQQVLRPKWDGLECLWQAFCQDLERLQSQTAGTALSRVMSGMMLLFQQEGFSLVLVWYFPLFRQAGQWLIEEERFPDWESGTQRRILLERIKAEITLLVKTASRNEFIKTEEDFFAEWRELIPDKPGREQVDRFFLWLQK